MLDRRRGIVLPFGGDVFRGKRLFFDGLEAQGNQADVLVPFLRPPLERREYVRGRGGYDHGVPFGPRRFFRLFQVGDLVCTMELLAEKAESNTFSRSESEFFGSPRTFRKDLLKGLRKKML